MKIIAIILALVVGGLIATSCSNANKNENGFTPVQVELIEEVAVSEEVVEPSDSDSIQVVIRGGSGSEGFGRCSKCNCKAFEGRGQTCRNCGHAYKAHY